MMFYICVKFHENISNDFQLTEQTKVHGRKGYVQRAITSKSRQIRVTTYEFCTSSHGALNLCEVSSQYLKRFQLTQWKLVMVEMAIFNIYDVQSAAATKVG